MYRRWILYRKEMSIVPEAVRAVATIGPRLHHLVDTFTKQVHGVHLVGVFLSQHEKSMQLLFTAVTSFDLESLRKQSNDILTGLCH